MISFKNLQFNCIFIYFEAFDTKITQMILNLSRLMLFSYISYIGIPECCHNVVHTYKFKHIFLLTVASVDHWPTECHRCVHVRWAHPARYPYRCYPADLVDLLAARDGDYWITAVRLVPISSVLMMTVAPIGDYYVVAPLVGPVVVIVIAIVRKRFAVAAVERRPIH